MSYLSEESIVNLMKSYFPNSDIGDDAAILPQLANQERYVVSKDLLIEGNHFRLAYFQPEELAIKSLEVNISDIAAMGAEPLFVFLGLAIPNRFSKSYLESYLKGFAKACKKRQIVCLGGDVVGRSILLTISISIIGKGTQFDHSRRSGARIGDQIVAVGKLGYARLGLLACERWELRSPFRKNCLEPKSLLREGIWLAKQDEVTSMMDISDGLYSSTKSLIDASKVSARLEIDRLRKDPIFHAECRRLKVDALGTMLTGGEDYSLLLTVDSSGLERLKEKFQLEFTTDFQEIGEIIEGSRSEIILSGMSTEGLPKGWFSHF